MFDNIKYAVRTLRANMLLSEIKQHIKEMCKDGFTEQKDQVNCFSVVSFTVNEVQFKVYTHRDSVYITPLPVSVGEFVVGEEYDDVDNFYPYGYIVEGNFYKTKAIRLHSISDFYDKVIAYSDLK